jgi:hypothetical protein
MVGEHNQLLWLFGISFHATTFIILCLTFITNITLKIRQDMDLPHTLVHSIALVTFTIHFYESIHAIAEFVYTDHLSSSILVLNIPVTIATFIILYWIQKPVPRPLLLLLSLPLVPTIFIVMGYCDFFTLGFPKTNAWVVSKILVSLVTISFFGVRDRSI